MVLLSLFLLLTACRSKEIEIPERNPTPLDPNTVGSISGEILFTGSAPEPKPISMGGFPGCLQGQHGPPLEEAIAFRDGKLKNVFVYIKQGLGEKVFSIPKEPVVFDQKGCIYTPHVLGVQRYQPVKILNSDPLLHNVHSLPSNQPSFNFGMAVAGLQEVVQFEKDEVMVKVKCDVHGWMTAYIGVLDHPYFAVTGDTGTFEIKNVPPGNYVIEAWHEVLGAQTKDVAVGEKQSVPVSLTFEGK